MSSDSCKLSEDQQDVTQVDGDGDEEEMSTEDDAQQDDDAAQEDAEAAGDDAEENSQEEESEADTGSEMSDEDEDEDTTTTSSATCANTYTIFSYKEAKRLLAAILCGLPRKRAGCVEAALMVLRKFPELAAKAIREVWKDEDGYTHRDLKFPMQFFLQDRAATVEQIKELYDLNPQACDDYEPDCYSPLEDVCKNGAEEAVLDFFLEKFPEHVQEYDCALAYFFALTGHPSLEDEAPKIQQFTEHEKKVLRKMFQLDPRGAFFLFDQFVFPGDERNGRISREIKLFLVAEFPPANEVSISFKTNVKCEVIKLISPIFGQRQKITINIEDGFDSGNNQLDHDKLAAFKYFMRLLEGNRSIEHVTFIVGSLVEPEVAAMARYVAKNRAISSLTLEVAKSEFFSVSNNWKRLWRATKGRRNLQANLRIRPSVLDDGVMVGIDGMVAFNKWLQLPNLKCLDLLGFDFANLEIATAFCETKVERMEVWPTERMVANGQFSTLLRQIAKMPCLNEFTLHSRGYDVSPADLKQLVRNTQCLSQLRLLFLPEDIQEIASAAQTKEGFSRLTCDMGKITYDADLRARTYNTDSSLVKTVSENSKLVLENVWCYDDDLNWLFKNKMKVQSDIGHQLRYYSLLNELGRSRVENACLTPDAFVKLLHNVTTYDDTHLSRLATKHSIQYELLRLRPSIWSVTFHKCSGDKRKNGSSKANEDDEAQKRQRRVA